MQDTSTTNRRTKRTFLGIPLIAWALLAMSGTALAAAVYYLTLGVTGTISLADGIEEYSLTFDTDPVVTGNCDAFIGPNVYGLNIVADDLLPGDFCEIHVGIANDGTVDAAFNGLMAEYPQGTGEVPGFGPQWECDENGQNCNVNYCGTVIPADGIPVEVGIRLDVGGDNQQPGNTYNFGAGDGFQFVVAGTENCG